MPAATSTAPTTREQLALFAKNFFQHPKMLGSIIPSSRFLIRRIVREVDWAKARVIVEYGPGVGTITQALLARMHPDARLVVLETNPEFVDYLRTTFKDARLHVVHGSAADVERVLGERGLEQADAVISGIPFSTLPADVRTAIVEATRRVLRPDGRFVVYQFSPQVLSSLRAAFASVGRGFEPRNVPPAQLFVCTP